MDIEVIKLKLPFSNPSESYVYLINSNVLIDAGFCSELHAEKLMKLEAKDVIVTHHHIDHVGIIFFAPITAHIHELEIPFVKFYTNPKKFIDSYAQICRSYGVPLKYLASLNILSELKLKLKAKIVPAMDELKGLKIIHAPGHTPGHVCVLADNALFSGDAVLNETTPNVGFHPEFSSMRSYLQSLEKILNLKPEVIYPAHEKPILDPEDCVMGLIEHYRSRIAEVYELLDFKPTSVEDLARNIKWSAGSYEKLDEFNRLLAVMETLAYLQYLVEEGKARVVVENFIKFAKAT